MGTAVTAPPSPPPAKLQVRQRRIKACPDFIRVTSIYMTTRPSSSTGQQKAPKSPGPSAGSALFEPTQGCLSNVAVSGGTRAAGRSQSRRGDARVGGVSCVGGHPPQAAPRPPQLQSRAAKVANLWEPCHLPLQKSRGRTLQA